MRRPGVRLCAVGATPPPAERVAETHKRPKIPNAPTTSEQPGDSPVVVASHAETTDAGSRSVETPVDSAARLDLIKNSLEDDKAEDVLVVDLRGKSPMADYMIIASGRSARHVGAICEKLMDRLKEAFGGRPRAEGVENGDWALIDASDVIVHVFRPEVREFYALEKMWAPAEAAKPAARPSDE